MRSSKQVLGPFLNETWFGDPSSGPGLGDEAIEPKSCQSWHLLRSPQNNSWYLFSTRPGLGISLQDLDVVGTKPFPAAMVGLVHIRAQAAAQEEAPRSCFLRAPRRSLVSISAFPSSLQIIYSGLHNIVNGF